MMICIRPDAVKKTDGLSAVAQDVINTVVCDDEFWPEIDQLIKTVKPLVDTIANCESRDASLATCMLELIRCAKKMSQLTLETTDNTGFWMHVKQVFNRHFHAMNTDYHSLALFLHPMCRKLATSQVANGRNFNFMLDAALSIAQQWRYDETKAKLLSTTSRSTTGAQGSSQVVKQMLSCGGKLFPSLQNAVPSKG